MSQNAKVSLALVEARHEHVIIVAIGFPQITLVRRIELTQFNIDIIERFETIDGKVRAHDKDPALTRSRPTIDHIFSEGLQPITTLVKSALIGNGPPFAVEAEFTCNVQTRRTGLKLVSITSFNVHKRY